MSAEGPTPAEVFPKVWRYVLPPNRTVIGTTRLHAGGWRTWSGGTRWDDRPRSGPRSGRTGPRPSAPMPWRVRAGGRRGRGSAGASRGLTRGGHVVKLV